MKAGFSCADSQLTFVGMVRMMGMGRMLARITMMVLLVRVMVRITMRKRHCTDAPSPVAGKDKVEAGHET